MNWLIYIGGYIIFNTLWMIMLKKAISFSADKNPSFGVSLVIGGILSIPSLMVWIWICLKFIRGI